MAAALAPVAAAAAAADADGSVCVRDRQQPITAAVSGTRESPSPIDCAAVAGRYPDPVDRLPPTSPEVRPTADGIDDVRFDIVQDPHRSESTARGLCRTVCSPLRSIVARRSAANI